MPVGYGQDAHSKQRSEFYEIGKTDAKKFVLPANGLTHTERTSAAKENYVSRYWLNYSQL